MLDDSKIVDHFVEQAKWCNALGSPFTAALLLRFASDFEARGPVFAICNEWPTNPRKDALGLRLTGALHHAVLSGASPDLIQLFPRSDDDWDIEAVWPVARAWLADHIPHVRRFIESPPQTNETRRSIILLPGFLKLAGRFNQPMHLLELGASAGLNQYWDRFNYKTSSWSRTGNSDVTIQTDWRAPVPDHLDVDLNIASRAGCDLNPIDLSDPDAVTRLKCYTWADQRERLQRLDAAVKLAQAENTNIEQVDALKWMTARLLSRPKSGVTVIYHSVFLIYPPRDVIAAIMQTIREAGAEATDEAPLAWLSYESEALFGGDRASPKMRARLKTWPGGEVETYAESDGHVTYVDPYPAGT
ncbi:MAG: DUF2332 domain-containing protein [Hyphomonadaceae bacterium]|nr:DUF2332 domain-containing protein [Hyphomonadaceae bacterium]